MLAGERLCGGEVLAVSLEMVGARIEVVGAARGEAAAVDACRDVREVEPRALVGDAPLDVRERKAGEVELRQAHGARALRMCDGAGEMRGERHLVVDVHAEAERGGIDLAREQREADLGHGLLTRVNGAFERDAAPNHRAAEAARREIDLRHALGVEGGRELRAAEQVVALFVEHLDLAVL